MKAIVKLLNPIQETKAPQGVTVTHRSLEGLRLFAVEQKDLSMGEQAFFAMLNNIQPHEQETEFFKVLGELSPKAIWVKEGMNIEIEDKDGYPLFYNVSGSYVSGPEIKWGDEEDNFFKVLCPTCNTYH